jgi:hypothetical protein
MNKWKRDLVEAVFFLILLSLLMFRGPSCWQECNSSKYEQKYSGNIETQLKTNPKPDKGDKY